jgi:hypothetical protein
MVLPFLFPAELTLLIAGPEEAKNLAGKEVLRLNSDSLSDAEFGKNLPNLSRQFAASPNR